MWEINNSLQILSFSRSLVLGILLCVLYDFIKSLRLTVNFSAIAIFLQDIAYSCIAAFVTFLFLLSVTNGEMRGYVISGILAGFIISRFTLSRLFCKFLKVSRIIKRRTVANEACDAGRVTVNGKPARASYDVKVGDIIEISFGTRDFKARVNAVSETVKKDDAVSLYELL